MKRLLTGVAVTVALLAASGCGANDGEAPRQDGASTTGSDDLEAEAGDALEDAGIDVPDVCLGQFVGLMSTPDLREVSLPASWPEPPVEATLCKTEEGGDLEEVGYATDASPDAVLDAYAAALAEHAPERTEGDGYGAGTLTGAVQGTSFVIQPRTGSYEIVLVP